MPFWSLMPSHIPGFLDCARRRKTHDYTSCPCCRVLVFMHEQLCRPEAHLFQPYEGQGSVRLGALTLAKLTGLLGSTVLGHGKYCSVSYGTGSRVRLSSLTINIRTEHPSRRQGIQCQGDLKWLRLCERHDRCRGERCEEEGEKGRSSSSWGRIFSHRTR